MAKSLLYRWFGIGGIPAQFKAALQSEIIVLIDEGISGSITYLNFRAPGRIANWRRQWFTASIALTQTRLVALRGNNPLINVPVIDERLRSMIFSEEAPGTLLVSFDASLFHSDWSGTIEYRFRTSEVQSFLGRLPKR